MYVCFVCLLTSGLKKKQTAKLIVSQFVLVCLFLGNILLQKIATLLPLIANHYPVVLH